MHFDVSVRSSKAENFLSPEILKYQTRDSGCNFSAVGSSGVLFMKRKAQKQTFEKLNRETSKYMLENHSRSQN